MLLHPSFAVNDAGHLTIGSLDAVELSKTFGTPTYYLDLDAVRAQCRMYRAAFAAHFGVNAFPVFAGKSLCFRKLYRVMAEEQMCADCVSPGELYTAHTAGFPMERIFFHGNNKTDADLRYAVELGVGHIVVDGPDELYALETIAAERQRQVSILLRITPGIDPHTHRKILTGNVDSKFGMAILTGQALSFVREALSMTHLTVEGFHCHIGSQIFTAAPFVDAWRFCARYTTKPDTWQAYSISAAASVCVMWRRIPYSKPQTVSDSSVRRFARCAVPSRSRSPRSIWSRAGVSLPLPGLQSIQSDRSRRSRAFGIMFPWTAGCPTIRATRYTVPATRSYMPIGPMLRRIFAARLPDGAVKAEISWQRTPISPNQSAGSS